MKRTLVTSALPYANGYLHLGHCAGAYLPADIYVRYKRLKAENILYVCGSDEHGVAITIAADKEKVTPKQIIDKYHYANKDAFEKLGMSFDIYSRTSLPLHYETAREYFKDFRAKGYLVDLEEDQFYDPEANMFLPDRYVEGICPNCGYEQARGDQCDSCGAYYDQLELKNPKSLVSGKPPVVKRTVHWYMRFDMFQKFLEDYIESHGDWKDNVLQQTRSWLKQGLAERAITRDLSWGVPIDGIPDIPPEKAKGKVLYVWFEAVLGYISATKELFRIFEEAQKAHHDDWKLWWQDEETRYIAFIGKDNIVFHTLIFPALLHAKGEGYILPDNVPANEFLNLEGQKFSKSRNWSIDLRDFIRDFPEPDKIDALRYTLAMNFPETKDSDFTWRDFQARNNNELAAIFGNFVNRALQFISKNFEGKVPQFTGIYKWIDLYWKNLLDYFKFGVDNGEDALKNIPDELKKVFTDSDIAFIWALYTGIEKIAGNYERFRFRDAITETMNVARAANKYFNDEEPWKSLKTNEEQCAKTLYICVQAAYSLSVLFAPVIPFTCGRIQKMLGVPAYTGESRFGVSKPQNFWEEALLPKIPAGTQIKTPEILFNRLEDDVVAYQVKKLGSKSEQAEEMQVENLIEFEEFKKIKLRTARILDAEKVPQSKKLIRLTVDLGGVERQIVAGIAEHYKPEDLTGKTVIVVANLKPAKLMGLKSEGMLLAASDAAGRLSLLTLDNLDITAGSEIS